MWKVEFYKTKNNKNPVRDFIKKQGEKENTKDTEKGIRDSKKQNDRLPKKERRVI